jgi:hypothetical protein
MTKAILFGHIVVLSTELQSTKCNITIIKSVTLNICFRIFQSSAEPQIICNRLRYKGVRADY